LNNPLCFVWLIIVFPFMNIDDGWLIVDGDDNLEEQRWLRKHNEVRLKVWTK